MVARTIGILALVASGLALAACAETGGAIAAQAVKEAAVVAATQAAIATTQAMVELKNASVQAANSAGNAVSSVIPQFPTAKGNYVIDTPTATYIQNNGQKIVIVKTPLPTDDGQ